MRLVIHRLCALTAGVVATLATAGPALAQYTLYPNPAAAPATAPPVAQQAFAPPVLSQPAYPAPWAQQVQQAAPPLAAATTQPAVTTQPTVTPRPAATAVATATQRVAPPATPSPAPPAAVYSQYAPAQGAAPARTGVASTTYPAAAPSAAASAPPYAVTPYGPVRISTTAPTTVPGPSLATAPAVVRVAQNAPVLTPPALPATHAAPSVIGEEYGPPAASPATAPASTAVVNSTTSAAATNPVCNCPGASATSGALPAESTAAPCTDATACGYEQPGAMSQLLSRRGGGYWFGGVYGLVMDRDSGDDAPLTFAGAGYAPGDYPAPTDAVLSADDGASDFQGGIELRLGRAFGAGPAWGVESVYWTLFDSDGYAQYIDGAPVRTVSARSMPGLSFNPGSGALPVDEFWDYGTPVGAGSIVVTMAKTRGSFEVQNLEVNLLRIGVCGDACAAGCDGGTCDACAAGDCAGHGYGVPARFSCTGVCGFRYFELDESFMYGVNYYDSVGATSGYLDYWSEAENRLFGGQIGCNGMVRLGARWGLHLNSLVGLYGNDVEVRQYFYSSGGQVTYSTGENFDVAASKLDVAVLGELRLGLSFQATDRCRLYGGWRAMGISGIALAAEQAPDAMLSASQLAGYVNSNDAMILHGLQTGVEWNY